MVPFPALGIHSAGADPIHPRFLLAPFFFFPFESVDLILYKFHFLDNLPVAVAISLLPPSPSSLLGRRYDGNDAKGRAHERRKEETHTMYTTSKILLVVSYQPTIS